jgi:hypothetical protein
MLAMGDNSMRGFWESDDNDDNSIWPSMLSLIVCDDNDGNSIWSSILSLIVRDDDCCDMLFEQDRW